jgi:ribosomal protein S18 acetylase RimI-like enzyme
MNWRVRQAGAADAAALSLVASATFLETFAGVLDGGDIVAHCAANNTAAKFTAWASDPLGAVTIAEVDKGHAPVGYAVLTTPDLPVESGPADIELKRIYTLSVMHGSGLGPALMDAAIEHAARLGRTRLLLGVYDKNLRALSFYRRSGFQVVGKRQFLVGSTHYDDLVLARDV